MPAIDSLSLHENNTIAHSEGLQGFELAQPPALFFLHMAPYRLMMLTTDDRVCDVCDGSGVALGGHRCWMCSGKGLAANIGENNQ